MVYGFNSDSERRSLWHDLHLCSTNLSWCLMGDFNVIKNLNETIGGEQIWDNGMEEFKDCLESLALDDKELLVLLILGGIVRSKTLSTENLTKFLEIQAGSLQ